MNGFGMLMQTSSGLYSISSTINQDGFYLTQLSSGLMAKETFDSIDQAVSYLETFNDEVFQYKAELGGQNNE